MSVETKEAKIARLLAELEASSALPTPPEIIHARQANPKGRRSVVRNGRGGSVAWLAAREDPSYRPSGSELTVCGAEPTSYDLSNQQARSKSGRPYLSCPECLARTEPVR